MKRRDYEVRHHREKETFVWSMKRTEEQTKLFHPDKCPKCKGKCESVTKKEAKEAKEARW